MYWCLLQIITRINKRLRSRVLQVLKFNSFLYILFEWILLCCIVFLFCFFHGLVFFIAVGFFLRKRHTKSRTLSIFFQFTLILYYSIYLNNINIRNLSAFRSIFVWPELRQQIDTCPNNYRGGYWQK